MQRRRPKPSASVSPVKISKAASKNASGSRLLPKTCKVSGRESGTRCCLKASQMISGQRVFQSAARTRSSSRSGGGGRWGETCCCRRRRTRAAPRTAIIWENPPGLIHSCAPLIPQTAPVGHDAVVLLRGIRPGPPLPLGGALVG